MIIKKNFSLKALWVFTGHHFLWLIPLMTLVGYLQFHTEMRWLRMPWQPISILGTAVAFYLGFKNNQSYDRVWEARKVWGAIVNSSRAWGATVRGFVDNNFDETISNEEVTQKHKLLIYNHISWLYALREQLLKPTPWEHISQNNFIISRWAKENKEKRGIGLFDPNITQNNLKKYLPKTFPKAVLESSNLATQIIDQQSQELERLRRQKLIDDFRHMELQKILNDFYIHQGKLERIKKFPLPRQYGAMSFVFVAIFIAVIPFGINPLFLEMGPSGLYASIFVSVLVAWVFLVMEMVGDYSENPFEGTTNDIPMYSLTRTIEIDLLEMINDTDIPTPVQPIGPILM